MTEHIVRSYDLELNELRSIVSRMGGLAEEQLDAATTALFELDVELAAKVRSTDKRIDAMELEVEKKAISLFVRRAPVADDLRDIISALKMTTLIERMGDYAKNIARRVPALREARNLEIPAVLNAMSTSARSMIHDVMDAYVHRDLELAIEVWERDEALDNLHNSAYQKILSDMVESPDRIGDLSHLLMIAKHYERIGDQATNLAELIHYAITNAPLDDRRPKNDLTSEPASLLTGAVELGDEM